MWKIILKLFGVSDEQFSKVRNLAYGLAVICGILLTVINPVFALPSIVIKLITVIGGILTGLGVQANIVKNQINDPNKALNQNQPPKDILPND